MMIPTSNNIFFLSKLPYDFSETLIEPEKEIVEYTDTHIFPIPASNELHINLPEVDLELPFCMISNSLGQQWTFIPEKLNVNNWVVDIHQLRRGVYFITYITNDKINTHTFVKM
ncbi:MAG: T9SS type A sorting domain-containing protein [Bacteroidetes bacterium]|nr:T9SS type A sorting domain-containing protein [Bacteroidota bacterium]